MKKDLQAKLDKLKADWKKDSVITFEQLGIDMMLVDESDNYKNLFLMNSLTGAGSSWLPARQSAIP